MEQDCTDTFIIFHSFHNCLLWADGVAGLVLGPSETAVDSMIFLSLWS